jgi:riboflavin synthase
MGGARAAPDLRIGHAALLLELTSVCDAPRRGVIGQRMFTGLIEELGTVVDVGGTWLKISAPQIAADIRVGDSVAVNGCCLTVATQDANELTFDLLQETRDRTNLGRVTADSRVNLERAVLADGRFGGHFVQGHIDCIAPIIAFAQSGADYRLEIELPCQSAQYVVQKGSIAVNGISLTVAEVSDDSFVVWIIPHTKQHTNLETTRTGDFANLEFDLLAKYVERVLDRRL